MFKLRSRLQAVHEIFDERSFTQVVRLERKRSDRSGRPFLLALLQLRDEPANGSGVDRDLPLAEKVIRSLDDCTRETDVAGWYKTGRVIGVVFTEISDDASVAEVIAGKVRAALKVNLDRGEVERVVISVYSYPNQNRKDSESDGDAEMDTELYPELSRPSSATLSKRAIDIFGSLGLLAILSPLLLVVALLVKLTSRGPILFRQTRIGQYGRPFTFYKFRSMYTNSGCELHEAYVRRFIGSDRGGEAVTESLLHDGLYKLRGDPRITPLGRILRRTSIDELPQLFNVLGGSMSLVGPRPPTPYEVKCYDDWHKRRVREATPGITGLWQVRGRSRTTFNEMVRLDLQYLNEWSVWTDIKILLQTPWAVLTCRGAC